MLYLVLEKYVGGIDKVKCLFLTLTNSICELFIDVEGENRNLLSYKVEIFVCTIFILVSICWYYNKQSINKYSFLF